MREVAALAGEGGELFEEAAVRADDVEAGENDGGESGGEEEIDLALDAVVDFADLQGDLFVAFIILHEEAGDGGAEAFLAGLQGEADLFAGFLVLAILCEGEGAVCGVPELGERGG